MAVNSPFNATTYANKATPVGADIFCLGDSAVLVSGVPSNKTLTMANLAAYVAANAITLSGVAGTLTATNANLTLSTVTSGTIALTSAGAITLTAAVASTIAMPAATAAALAITNGTTSLLAFDTRIGTSGVKALAIQPPASLSFAAAAGNAYSLASLSAFTLTQTGSTLVTALGGLSLTIASPTVTDASALTITTASSVLINGPLPSGSVTFTNSFALDIPTFVTNGTQAAGLRVAAPSGSGTNQAALFLNAAGGTICSINANALNYNGAINLTSAGQVNANGGSATTYAFLSENNGTYGIGTGFASVPDVALGRSAAAVFQVTDGSSGWGWLQQSAGTLALSANFTDATGTLAATNFSFPVVSGRTYAISGFIDGNNSTGTEGFQMTFSGVTATAILFEIENTGLGTVVLGTQSSAAIDTAVTATTFINGRLRLTGYFRPSATGNLIVKMAEVSHAVGTLTINANTWIKLEDMRSV